MGMGMELSRIDFVKVLAAAGGTMLFPLQAAIAAVPSLEEYNVGSGSFIKKNEQPTYTRRTFTAPADSASVLKALEETKEMLNSFGVSIPEPHRPPSSRLRLRELGRNSSPSGRGTTSARIFNPLRSRPSSSLPSNLFPLAVPAPAIQNTSRPRRAHRR